MPGDLRQPHNPRGCPHDPPCPLPGTRYGEGYCVARAIYERRAPSSPEPESALPRRCPACDSPEKWGDQHAPWCAAPAPRPEETRAAGRCGATPNPGSTLRCDRPAGHDGNHSAWTRGEHGVYGHTNWEPALCPECDDTGWRVPVDPALVHMKEPCPFCAKGYEIGQAQRRASSQREDGGGRAP